MTLSPPLLQLVIAKKNITGKQLVKVLASIMHFNRSILQRGPIELAAFDAIMPSTWWEKGFPGETRNRSHEEQVLGDTDKTIAYLHEFRMGLAKIIDNAKASV